MKEEIAFFEKLDGEDIERGIYLRKFGIQIILFSRMLTIAFNHTNWIHISWYNCYNGDCRGFEASLKTFCVHRLYINNNGTSYNLD